MDYNWFEKAACRRAPPKVQEYFTSDDPVQQETAKALCTICTVARQCRYAAIIDNLTGVCAGQVYIEGQRVITVKGKRVKLPKEAT